jgi:hypothetical protein
MPPEIETMEPLTCSFCAERIAGIPLMVHVSEGLVPVCTQDCFRAVQELSKAHAKAMHELHELKHRLHDQIATKRRDSVDSARQRLERLYQMR